jgi:competence protein ComEA
MKQKKRIVVVAVIGVLAIAGWGWSKQEASSKTEARIVARAVNHVENRPPEGRIRSRPVTTETKVITVTVVVERVRVGSNLRHRWMSNGTLKLFCEDVYETRPVNVRSTVSPQTPTPVSALVNLNTATIEELDARLDGIGPVMARKIVAARPFRTIEDLNNISGIGPRRMAAIKHFVTVN